MLQIVNKGIFFSSFFQKRERKEKIKTTKPSKGGKGMKMSLGNSWWEGEGRGGGGGSPDAPKWKFLG